MASEKLNPAPRGGADNRARNAISWQAINSENITPQTDLQHLRARVLARRFALPASVARAVAELHFGEVVR